jgi:hypothetical protein
MAGDIKQKYGTETAYTWTSLNSLAGSSSMVAGASCLAVDNTSTLALDYLVAGKITWSSTAPAAGTYQLNIYAYTSIDGTPNYVQDGSGNALGTDAAKTFAQASDIYNACNLLKSLTLYTTASKVYTFSRQSIANLFGACPSYHGLWATHGVTTGSSTPAASGNSISYTPVLAQYT